ncbi:MAG: class I SAM-dependent methyltransferase [Oxalobacter sp.]|nr:MAG: class I SAM-dependent methyltransferase [Oxalobacter sp.]
MTIYPTIEWEEDGETRIARWRSERDAPPPKRVVLADDTMKADTAFRLASEGTALLWQGDFHNARQLLNAIARRVDHKPQKKPGKLKAKVIAPAETFHQHRQAQSQRARTLGMLLIPLNADYSIPLRRAPDVHLACADAYGESDESDDLSVVSLREILGLIGAHEWRKKGVPIDALKANIHPHYGVFSPVRGEYIKLVAEAPLPSHDLAFDIGTGTGVLAAVLARRGVKRIIATDNDPRALACAKENIERLGVANQVEVVQKDLFPEGRAPLIVCNPPWVPARPVTPIERAVYDPENVMLNGFLSGLAAHLTKDGEGWLILSDLAEHLGLRTRETLLAMFEQNGLRVIDRLDAKPTHPKVMDATDPLHPARMAEVTSLWRLGAKNRGQ